MSNVQCVKISLNFETMRPRKVVLGNGEILEKDGGIEDFVFSETTGMQGDMLICWISRHMNIVFDGDLDNPENFSKVKIIGLYGPSSVKYTSDGLALSDLSIYIEAETSLSEDDIDELEDIFHLIVPIIKSKEGEMEMTEWESYNIEIVEELPSNLQFVEASWSSL